MIRSNNRRFHHSFVRFWTHSDLQTSSLRCTSASLAQTGLALDGLSASDQRSFLPQIALLTRDPAIPAAMLKHHPFRRPRAIWLRLHPPITRILPLGPPYLAPGLTRARSTLHAPARPTASPSCSHAHLMCRTHVLCKAQAGRTGTAKKHLTHTRRVLAGRAHESRPRTTYPTPTLR